MNSHKVGRNDPCPCGSGKKFKKCCLDSQRLDEPAAGWLQAAAKDFIPSAFEETEGDILEYDPFVQPDPDHWLAMDEQDRIDAVADYHRRARIHVARAELHATFHAIVENQIADAKLPVRSTVERLMAEGLDRHEAVHAVGSVLAAHMHDLMTNFSAGDATSKTKSSEDPHAAYYAELEALTAEQWLRSG